MDQRCTYCRNLSISNLVLLACREFEGGAFPKQAYYQHHGSIRDLEKSSGAGCDLCGLISRACKAKSWEESGQQSVHDFAKGLDVSDVKLALNSDHVYAGETLLSAVQTFDRILIKIGQAEKHSLVSLVLEVPRENSIMLGDIRIGQFQLDGHLGSEAYHAISKSWLRECDSTHPGCLAGEINNCLPTRVIDVGTLDGSREPFLVHSKGRKGRYIALSHCWGGIITPLLDATTFSPFQTAIPYASLPANFQDAITITRHLGIQYLWIDSLCIIQDSKEDWQRESKKMGTVYRDSTVTISALVSPGSKAGILRRPIDAVGSSSKVSVALPVYPGSSITTVQVTQSEPVQEDLHVLEAFCALSSRGWTLQEYILSPRHIFYGAQQTYWRCPQGFQSSSGTPDGKRFPGRAYPAISSLLFSDLLHKSQGHDPPDVGVEKVLEEYRELVGAYSHRKLTYGSDKLPAFSGLAERLGLYLKSRYLAGLWEVDLLRGLLWFPASLPATHVRLPFRAPSWSWAVTDDPIYYLPTARPLAQSPLNLRLVDVAMSTCDKSNPYGQLESARLTVRGRIKPLARSVQVVSGLHEDRIGTGMFDEPAADVELSLHNNRTQLFRVNSGEWDYIVSVLFTRGEGTGFEIDGSQYVNERYMALLVHGSEDGTEDRPRSHVTCLVLRLAEDQSEEAYVRAGILILSGADPEWVDTWEERDVILV